MPLFEYICCSCNHKFEELQKTQGECPACPNCGCEQTELLISAPGPLKKGAFPFKPGPVSPLAKFGGGGCGGNCKINN